MKVVITKKNQELNTDCLTVLVDKSNLKSILSAFEGLYEASQQQEFLAKKLEVMNFRSLAGFKQILLVGIGDSAHLCENDLVNIGGEIYSHLIPSVKSLAINTTSLDSKEENIKQSVVKNLLIGLKIKSWSFNKYYTSDKKEKSQIKISEVKFITGNQPDISADNMYATAIAEGVDFTRNLIMEPANKMYSSTFVLEVQKLTELGVEVEVLNKKQLEELGMGALLAVNQGSDKEPNVCIAKWNGGAGNPIAFVGKGVTFDSGGLSIKPSQGMVKMKKDMSGAAVVMGLMKSLAMRKAKVNAIGVVGLVENMINGSAMRPGDVVLSASGKTIEISNTDAEGRLVLADLLHYVATKYKPSAMIDLATLTGAIIVSLGSVRAGLFSNDNELSSQLIESGDSVNEKLWRFPLDDEYRKLMKSSIADIAHMPKLWGSAASITAAIFLKEFIGETKWAHLDIAGTSWYDTSSSLNKAGYPSGYGVRLLNSLIEKHYESNN